MPGVRVDQAEGSKGAKAPLNVCASVLSSSSDSMHAFQSSRSGMLSNETSTCLYNSTP